MWLVCSDLELEFNVNLNVAMNLLSRSQEACPGNPDWEYVSISDVIFS